MIFALFLPKSHNSWPNFAKKSGRSNLEHFSSETITFEDLFDFRSPSKSAELQLTEKTLGHNGFVFVVNEYFLERSESKNLKGLFELCLIKYRHQRTDQSENGIGGHYQNNEKMLENVRFLEFFSKIRINAHLVAKGDFELSISG